MHGFQFQFARKGSHQLLEGTLVIPQADERRRFQALGTHENARRERYQHRYAIHTSVGGAISLLILSTR